MQRTFNKLIIFLLVFGFVFFASGFISTQKVYAAGACFNINQGKYVYRTSPHTQRSCEALNPPEVTIYRWDANAPTPTENTPETTPDVHQDGSGFGWIVNTLLILPGWISQVVLMIANLIFWLSGAILNVVVQYTVVDMSKNITGDTISKAWKVIRDVANMAFIFVLLYAAIQTILGVGKDTQRLIVKVVVVAVLINFSLFFTRVVIDISNVLAMTFYDAIAPGSLESTASRGIANSLSEPLKIQNLMESIKGLPFDGTKLVIIGVMGTIVALIASFVFFAIALMFIIRFVILILVLVLSPIAFIAFILPQAEKYQKQWSDALIGQAFFAPIYFMLTWVVIMISRGLFKSEGTFSESFLGKIEANGSAAAGDVTVVMNFIIIIVLLVASLMVAKDWASRGPDGIKKLTGWATGAAGGMTLGMAGRFGRNTFGRAGQALGENEKLKEAVAKGGMKGMAARLTLAAGRKSGGASFDLRGAGIGGQLDAGKAGGKGGFADYRKKKAESEAKFAGTLGASDKVTSQAEKDLENIKLGDVGARTRLEAERSERRDQYAEEVKRLAAEIDQAESRGDSPFKIKELKDRLSATQKRVDSTRDVSVYAQAKVDELKGADDERAKQIAIERNLDPKNKGVIASIKKEFKSAGEVRKQAFATATEKSIWAKFRGYNYAAAAQIRKGKSAKDKIADAVKDLNKEEGGGEEEAAEKPAEGKPAEEKGKGDGGEGTKT